MNTTTDPATTDAAPDPSSTGVHDRHLVLRHRLGIDGVGVPIIGGVFFLAVLLLTLVVSIFVEIRISGWEVGAQLIRWFVGAIGVYITGIYLPLYVLYGRTRREVAVDAAVFAGIYAALVAVLVTLGYAVEGLVYRAAGWTRGLENVHLFDAPDQYHLVLLEHVVVLAVWVAAGAMLGAAFYRNGLLGLALLPVALAAVMTTEAGTGPGHFGPLPPPLLEFIGLQIGTFSPLAAASWSAGCFVVLAAVTWPIVRDVPIRNQAP